jgi:virulence factor Mce-like protein
MVKSAPSLGRIAAMVIFALSCFGLLLFLWLAFGGSVPLKPKGYRFHTSFAEAGQLSQEADVRISGVPVGKVKVIKADKVTGRADVTIQLDARYAPLPKDAKAILRQKTLLGETYVELTPGHSSGGFIPRAATCRPRRCPTRSSWTRSSARFDPATRAAFQQWMQAQGEAIANRGQDLNDALGNLGPFADDTATLVSILNRQEGAVSRLIANTGVVFGALNERDGQLTSLIKNTNTVFATTASRDNELQAAFKALPTFEDESKTTLARLTRFSHDTDPLVTQLRPAARELSPTLRDLADVAPDLKNLLEQLQPLIDASKRGFPAAEKVLEDSRPLIAQLLPATQQLTPMIQFLGTSKRELTSFFANSSVATQATDPDTNLHYLRTTNPLNPENLAVYPKRLQTNRPNPYRLPNGFDQLATGLPVYEDRQCTASNAMPSITNVPIDVTNTVTSTVSDATGGLVTLPPIPQVPLSARAGAGADPRQPAPADPALRVQ